MTPRYDYAKAAPGAYEAMRGLEKYLHDCGLEPALVHLVKLRASQLNGCAYCLDMHSKEDRAAGESEHRLYVLDAWRAAPFFSERERAALAFPLRAGVVQAGGSRGGGERAGCAAPNDAFPVSEEQDAVRRTELGLSRAGRKRVVPDRMTSIPR